MMNLKSTASRKKSNRIKTALTALAAVVCMACIWPIGVISLEKTSKSRATDYLLSGYVKDGVTYGQFFIPAYEYLDGIMIKIVRGAAAAPEEEGKLTLTLYDASDMPAASVTEPVGAFEDKNYHMLPLGVKVEKGSQYYYTIEVTDCKNEGVQVLFADTGRVELAENTVLSYDGQNFPMYSTMAVYQYQTALGIENIAMYDAWIVMIALLVLYGTGSKTDRQYRRSNLRYARE